MEPSSTEALSFTDPKTLDGIQGFIFDCDGTLLDSIAAWEEAEDELFKAAGLVDKEAQLEIHLLPIEEAARTFHEVYGVGESTQAILDHIDALLLDYYTNKAELLPGAAEYVKKVAEAGIPMVILSSSPRHYLEPGLKRVGLLEYFKDLITADGAGFAKSDVRIYQHAMEVLGSGPGNTWGADDNPGALKAMEEAGVRTIGVGKATEPVATVAVENLIDLL